MRYFSTSLILIVTIMSLLITPIVNALERVTDDEMKKSGEVGEEVDYEIVVRNDNQYPIDILVKIGESEWKVEIEDEEIKNVQVHDTVTFKVTITIPKNPKIDESDVKIEFWEKGHIIFADDYVPISLNGKGQYIVH